ncbi:MAG TPA: alanine--tRNA ligase [Candidatus Paceibacterota bacterium]
MTSAMTSSEIRSKFLEFFEKKGHKIVSSSSLIPKDDPSVLFTTAGMQQFKPYYTNDKSALKDFGSKNTVSIQKCIRTSDIEEVGDDSHNTFFEMLGNFSFGGYGKKMAIEYAYEFITREMGLDISYVSVFGGLKDSYLERDEESKKIWQALGIRDIREEEMSDVFWGPTGNSGPCGPTTEIYCKNIEGENIEIWNIVFNEFYCHGSREQLLNAPNEIKIEKLPFLGIDTGMGFERLLYIVQRKKSVFETDVFQSVMDKIKVKSENWNIKSARIVADHVKASIFMIADGVAPSNTDRGYVLRRLLRRATRYAKVVDLKIYLSELVDFVLDEYKGFHENILKDKIEIKKEIDKEVEKFDKTIGIGLREFNKISTTDISGNSAFTLFSSYGLPIDVIIDLAKEKKLVVDVEGFEKEFKKHQNLSRTGAEQKFKGGLADTSEMSKRYHTATHLLHQALHDVLGKSVMQKGSNITPERLRFDFSHDSKMTSEEKKKVEDIVNQKIGEDLPVQQAILPKAEAEKIEARHSFDEKYGSEVSIYYIGKNMKDAYSKEFCGGPHIVNTKELAGPEGKWKFKILKEEALSQGVRRIKAVLD